MTNGDGYYMVGKKAGRSKIKHYFLRAFSASEARELVRHLPGVITSVKRLGNPYSIFAMRPGRRVSGPS